MTEQDARRKFAQYDEGQRTIAASVFRQSQQINEGLGRMRKAEEDRRIAEVFEGKR